MATEELRRDRTLLDIAEPVIATRREQSRHRRPPADKGSRAAIPRAVAPERSSGPFRT
jgi:hypothetical protein